MVFTPDRWNRSRRGRSGGGKPFARNAVGCTNGRETWERVPSTRSPQGKARERNRCRQRADTLAGHRHPKSPTASHPGEVAGEAVLGVGVEVEGAAERHPYESGGACAGRAAE